MRILYSSIDKINKPHNVQLKLHSSIPFSIKNHSYLCSVIFGQEEKNKNKTGRNVKAEQKKPKTIIPVSYNAATCLNISSLAVKWIHTLILSTLKCWLCVGRLCGYTKVCPDFSFSKAHKKNVTVTQTLRNGTADFFPSAAGRWLEPKLTPWTKYRNKSALTTLTNYRVMFSSRPKKPKK